MCFLICKRGEGALMVTGMVSMGVISWVVIIIAPLALFAEIYILKNTLQIHNYDPIAIYGSLLAIVLTVLVIIITILHTFSCI